MSHGDEIEDFTTVAVERTVAQRLARIQDDLNLKNRNAVIEDLLELRGAIAKSEEDAGEVVRRLTERD